MRVCLWVSVLAWSVSLGAKLFDLLVVAGAWSASPPTSLKLMPYGPNYPMNPGHFFLPTSVVILISSVAAAILGWNTPNLRMWLLSSTVLFVALFVFTAIVFWPMNGALYRAGTGEVPMSGTAASALAHRWIVLDWLRVTIMAAGFYCSSRAFSLLAPR